MIHFQNVCRSESLRRCLDVGDPPHAGSGRQLIGGRLTVGIRGGLIGVQLVQAQLTYRCPVAEEVHLENGALAGGRFSRERKRTKALAPLRQRSVILIGRGIVDARTVEGEYACSVRLVIARRNLHGEGFGVGQNTVYRLVAYDGGRHAHGSDGGRIDFERILIQDGKVGELIGSDGADFIFHMVLVCGDDGDRVEGLQHIDPLVIIPESPLGAVLGFGIHGNGVEILAFTTDQRTALAQRRGGRNAGDRILHTAERRDRGDRRVVVYGERQIIRSTPAAGIHILGAAGTHEYFHVAVAPVECVVDEVGVDEILFLHQFPVLKGGAESRIHGGATQLRIHILRGIKL